MDQPGLNERSGFQPKSWSRYSQLHSVHLSHRKWPNCLQIQSQGRRLFECQADLLVNESFHAFFESVQNNAENIG